MAAAVLLLVTLLSLQACTLSAATGLLDHGHTRKLLTYTWSPPTPRLPSYPCRTMLPRIKSSFTVIYVNPATANTNGDGSQARPFGRFADAWRRIPAFRKLTKGVVINVYPGISGSGVDSFWMEGVWGTRSAPVIIQKNPESSAGAADIQSINVWNCTYLYFKDITFRQAVGSDGGGDVVHFAYSDYIYLLGVTVVGQTDNAAPQETIKVNQVKGMYIEDSDVSQAADNVIDFVAVQYGHICRSKVHEGNWCLYVKGGSSYILIDSNTVTRCGESGLSVGQGTGFEYMIPPWINYEAYGVTVTNNVITDVWGAGLGVEGGYNVIMAYNTLYNIGSRSHAVEFLYGSRSCDGDDSKLTAGKCSRHRNRGGWGPGTGGRPVAIPNKNVYFMNNLVVNADDRPTQWSHFAAPVGIPDDFDSPAGVAKPSVADNLRIQGNVIINRRTDGNPMDLGLGACSANNRACNERQVMIDNTINPNGVNLIMIIFGDATNLIPNEASKAALARVWKPAQIPAFPTWSTPVKTPPGDSVIAVRYGADGGVIRSGGDDDLPGADMR